MMRMISWNVNGIRACLGKGFLDSVQGLDADMICLQETKCQPGQVTLPLDGYEQYWLGAEKKGYSSTALFSRRVPDSVAYGIGVDAMDHEGRVITAEYPGFYLVNVYTPNSQDGLARLPYRMEWEEAFLHYVKELEKTHPVVICGDMNVAHTEKDIKNAKSNQNNAGFTPQERACMTRLLDSGFVDTFRYMHPDAEGAYSWWSYRFHARENNAGWRIDYFLVSRALDDRIEKAEIHPEIMGSDHCPVELVLKMEF